MPRIRRIPRSIKRFTKVEGRIAIRFQTGSIETTEGDLDVAFDVIRGLARKLL
jgi:aromatic-L-amino-acid decarboxylase